MNNTKVYFVRYAVKIINGAIKLPEIELFSPISYSLYWTYPPNMAWKSLLNYWAYDYCLSLYVSLDICVIDFCSNLFSFAKKSSIFSVQIVQLKFH